MKLGPALQKGPYALQQDGKRTESGVSSSLQLLAWGISGPIQCSAARTCVASAMLLLCGLGKVNDTECANVLAEICERPSLPRRELGKSTVVSDAQGRRHALLVEQTGPPEQLTLGVADHRKAEASPHPGH